jgi:hypothetical protein
MSFFFLISSDCIHNSYFEITPAKLSILHTEVVYEYLPKINSWLISLMELQFVFCEAASEYLNIIYRISGFWLF